MKLYDVDNFSHSIVVTLVSERKIVVVDNLDFKTCSQNFENIKGMLGRGMGVLACTINKKETLINSIHIVTVEMI